MEFFEVIYGRRAVRKFKSDPVNREDILRILNAANYAPSGMNRQQWEFIVVSGEKKDQLGDSYAVIADAYTSGWEQREREQFMNYARTYGGAPIVIVVLTDASDMDGIRKMNLESASAAMENLLLAARALDLGTCWMTGPLNDEASVRKILNIPDSKEIVALTPLGYPEKFPQALPRLDPELKDKVRWLE
ncbi:nitroreductase family protein [hydrocarbon metagenome]|uniref:Nitroreductase family protein n=1 Tax=hydrocarbon metagenome TaxID=938273 RepID=A0A0W8E4B4_9ZZZZ